MLEANKQGRRGRIAALVVATGAGAAVLAVSLDGNAGAAKVEVIPTTTVIASSQNRALTTDGQATVLAAVAEALPTAKLDHAYQVVDGVRDLVSASGTIDGDGIQVTVYRRFEPKELEDFGMRELRSLAGRSWVGATDPDLTSVYHLSGDGVAVWVGVTPAPGSKARSVEAVQAIAERLAEGQAVEHVAEGGAR